METMVKVTMKDGVHSVVRGTTLSALAKECRDNYPYDIILAKKNGSLCELFKTIDSDCEVEFLTIADSDGNRTYARGMFLMMIRAIYTVLGKEKVEKVRIEHRIGHAYYGEIDGSVKLTEELAQEIKKEMRRLVAEKVVFHKRTITTADCGADSPSARCS